MYSKLEYGASSYGLLCSGRCLMMHDVPYLSLCTGSLNLWRDFDYSSI